MILRSALRLLTGRQSVTRCIPNRGFWQYLNSAFNKVDQTRIDEVGPDQACAEWLLRCGAQFRWKGKDKFLTDYNSVITSVGKRNLVIEEINADDAAIMEIGFPHLRGCNHIEKVRIHYCSYMQDEAIVQLILLKNSLRHLEISSCGDVTDQAINSLGELSLLQTLLLYDLPAVSQKKDVYNSLRSQLPHCEITYKDI